MRDQIACGDVFCQLDKLAALRTANHIYLLKKIGAFFFRNSEKDPGSVLAFQD